MKCSAFFHRADRAIAAGKISDLLSLSDELVGYNDDSSRSTGYMLKGMAYEIGGDGVEQDFDKAINNYRQASCLLPATFTYVCMARAMMKKGPAFFSSALRVLGEAESLGYAPELDIALGACYENSPEPDYILAKKHYLNAAINGRFHGFFGYSSVCRKMGQPVRAGVVDLARIILGPLLFVFFGKRASDGI